MDSPQASRDSVSGLPPAVGKACITVGLYRITARVSPGIGINDAPAGETSLRRTESGRAVKKNISTHFGAIDEVTRTTKRVEEFCGATQSEALEKNLAKNWIVALSLDAGVWKRRQLYSRRVNETSIFKTRALQRASQKEETKMKQLLAVSLSLLTILSLAVMGQKFSSASAAPQAAANSTRKRGPIFRATKEQIKQAQAILKTRGFYSGEATAKLDDATREGLRDYQKAEGLKITGTMNKLTLEKMGIELTEKQKAM